MNSGIYMILNLINNKYYIGSSHNLYKRWHTHKSTLKHNKHDNSYLQKAWNKYGELNFKFFVLEYTNELLIREQYWIDKLLCINRKLSYNLRKLANTNLGIKFSEETKAKISASNKGRVISEETKLKLKLAQRNRPPISEKTRNKLRLSKLNQSTETKQKISNAKKGVKRTEDAKAKMRLGWIKRKNKNAGVYADTPAS